MKHTNKMTAKVYLAVGIGGMFGANCRYMISILLKTENGFPFATLITNLIGCFLLSYLLNQDGLKQKLSPEIVTALGTGVIGAFTTFSTFAVETIELWNSNIPFATIYVLTSIVGGLASCFVGYRTAIGRRLKS